MMRFQSRLGFSILHICIASALVISCRATSPRASKPLSEPVLTDSTIKKELSPTEKIAPSAESEKPAAIEVKQTNATSLLEPHRKVELPQNFRPEIIQYVHIKPLIQGVKSGDYAWSVDLRTGMEIWCETRCSDFKLFDQLLEGDRQLVAMKATRIGNTKPGMLNLKTEVRGSRSKAKRVIIEHVGALWNSVVVDAVMFERDSDFYALPMALSVKTSPENDIQIWGDFNGSPVKVEFAKDLPAPVFEKNVKTLNAFVFGGIVKANKSPGSQVFLVSKMISPWTGE